MYCYNFTWTYKIVRSKYWFFMTMGSSFALIIYQSYILLSRYVWTPCITDQTLHTWTGLYIRSRLCRYRVLCDGWQTYWKTGGHSFGGHCFMQGNGFGRFKWVMHLLTDMLKHIVTELSIC